MYTLKALLIKKGFYFFFLILWHAKVQPFILLKHFTLKVCLFGAFNTGKDDDKSKYVYSSYGIARDINIKVFNIIRRINEAKVLIKHISCGCKCKFNTTTCNLNQKWNNDVCHSESKKYCTC